MDHTTELRRLLHRVRRRWVGTVVMRAIARTAAGVSAVILTLVGLDAWVVPAEAVLLALAGLALLAAAGLVLWGFWPLRRRPTDRQVARFVEEHCPEFEDGLVSATELDRPGERTTFQTLTIGDAIARVRGLELERIISRTKLQQAAWHSVVAMVALVVSGVLSVAPASRAVRAARLQLLPETVEIIVEPGDTRVVAGQPLRVRARLQGAPNLHDGPPPTLSMAAGGVQGSAPMTPAGDGFLYEFARVDSSFTYRVSAARASSREYSVTALFPPHVERIDLEYRYPSFTGLAPRLEADGGDIYAPAGTNVRLRVFVDKPVRTGALVLADGSRVTLEGGPNDSLEGRLTISDDGAYRVTLADLEGLTSPGDTEYFIRVMDDRPPDVRILRPAGDRQVTPLEEVAIEARADDDYGLERFELVYSVQGGQERQVPFQAGGTASSLTGSCLLYVEDLEVQPGDFITYFARATDVARGKKPSEARSDIYFLEIRAFGEEFSAAQSQGIGGGGGESLDMLIKGQKDIISATWNLERRSRSGRSEQDIRAVARAQAELKTRAEEAAARQLRARAHGRPGQAGRSVGADENSLLGLAAEAMARAQAELERLRTTEARPHELEALNRLLKAQAEIRQREVSRLQAGGSGSGSGRQSRDLSALFDRELQRQQETNYETPPRAQTEPGARDEALEEIRDLARRQDELARQQRDLARSALSPEELKRQLERLTREQTELRQQLEELARQMAGQDQAGRQPSGQTPTGGESQSARAGEQQVEDRPGGRQGGSTGSEQLREITEEMRVATSDLRRENLEAARERSERAAQKLHELERQWRGGQADERRRAMGELEVEAQQIADAQRQIAGEAERLEAGEAGRDARQRLAGGKEGLADRVDELSRRARQLAAGSTGDEARPAADAAAQIDRQQLGDRMRATAEQLRRETEGGEPTEQRESESASASRSARETAEAEEQLARALERVAETLAADAPGDQEVRRLSEQLAGARELRERLDQIERRLADLDRQANEQGGSREASPDSQSAQRGGTEPDPSQGSGGITGSEPGGELARLQEGYARQLRELAELMDRLGRENPNLGAGYSPAEHEWSLAAPGTQAFKQDYSRWELLRRGVGEALERYEAMLSQQLAEHLTADRLAAGASEEMPEAYRQLVARYYESLAKKKKE